MIKKYNRGFTLIELLVVIAIIGILSGIVITALSGARDKAKDAKVKGDLAGFRTAAELSYNDNGNSYDTTGGGLSVCAPENPSTKTYLKSLGSLCKVAANSYSMAAPLEDGKFWCVDSDGYSGFSVGNNTADGCDAPAEDATNPVI